MSPVESALVLFKALACLAIVHAVLMTLGDDDDDGPDGLA